VDTSPSSVASNLAALRERIARAASRAARRPQEITLVAISKTFSAGHIRAAFEAGIRHFGENRVQEWESKQPQLTDLDATWHLVGHLQSNKAARAAKLFHTIDSLDRLELARKLDRYCGDPPLTVLIEVRLSSEETKSGVGVNDLPALAEAVLALPHLDLQGLMCIPPLADDPGQARPYFRRLRDLRDSLSRHTGKPLPELSMGMSHDFEVAIEEGATQVRIGTALFGPRPSI
jgi:pyridoxal phosphate enzyme (YggS family)